MTDITATRARREFSRLVQSAAERHEVYHIRHQKSSVVLLSQEDYEGLVETIELLSVPGFRESIQRSADQMNRGETVSLDEALEE